MRASLGEGCRGAAMVRKTWAIVVLVAAVFLGGCAGQSPASDGGFPEPGGQVGAATITVGAGFTLLRLTGHIRCYGSEPELLRQRADLQSWTGRRDRTRVPVANAAGASADRL